MVIWSLMVITDYNRAKDMKPPLFAYYSHNQYGGGFYDGLGYSVWARTKAFNGVDHVLYDMHFMMFGRGKNQKKTIADFYFNHYLLLGDSKESVFSNIEALEYIVPQKDKNEEIYSEHAFIDGSRTILNLVFYKDVMIGFDYQFDNFEVAYDYAAALRRDLELTFDKNPTQRSSKLFDSIKDDTMLHSDYSYCEYWTMGSYNNKKDNIEKIFEDKKYSRADICFELKIVDENNVTVSTRIVSVL